MILLDEIEFYTEPYPGPAVSLGKVPSVVAWTRSAKRVEQNVGLVTVNELRASFTKTPPAGVAQVRWRGTTYAIDGTAMIRMRGSRVHHYTYTLKSAL